MRTLFAVSVLVISLAPLNGFADNPGSAAPEASSGSPVIGQRSAALLTVFDAKVGRERQVSVAQAAKIIREYWTPERLAAAIPESLIADSEPAVRQSSPPEDQVERDVARPISPRLGKAPATVTSYTEGKVYYRKPDGTDWQCSGSAVNSAKRRLVWTAGHCVHTGPDANAGWMTNWIFVPGYDYGSRPAGTFPYYQLWAKNGWINNRDWHYDYGVAITWNNEFGWRVVDRVGGNGLTINPGRPFVTAIGYPSNIFSGEAQSYCQAWLRASNSRQELDCARCPGGSGEPWLRDYNFANGLGYIVSNYSTYPDASCRPVHGPYYDDATWSLYQAAENASP